jgi:plastocyanin
MGKINPTTGVDDFQSQFPDLASESYGWDPSTMFAKSGKKVEWICEKKHQYTARIADRANGSGCPYCSGHKVWQGFNDLQSLFPAIASEADEWDPSTITSKSNKQKGWVCQRGHKYIAKVGHRTHMGSGCPYCAGRKIMKGFNDLQSMFPLIAAEANGWDPTTVTGMSGLKRQWKCNIGHLYSSIIANRTTKGKGCPYCAGKRVLSGFNDLRTRFPEIAAEADGWDPTKVTAGLQCKKNWICPKGHKYSSTINNRTSGKGCPYCAEYGFNPVKPAWIYLMSRANEQQFGITNDLATRLKTHQRNGWDLMEEAGPFDGKEVYDLELVLKKWLRKEIGAIPGTKENWIISTMEIKSLRQLKEKSGLKTGLF